MNDAPVAPQPTLPEVQALFDRVLELHPDATLAGNTISHPGSLSLGSLTTLSPGVTLSAGRWIDLRSLKALSEGVTLSAEGSLYLSSLTTLSPGVTLSAGGWIYFGRLTTPRQRYQGRDIYLEQVDGYTMERLSAPRRVGEYAVWRAAYFNGRADAHRCYIAQRDKYTAHGCTLAEAIRDCEFKRQEATVDRTALVAEIRSRGSITFDEYRLLTGACESGLRQGLVSLGLPADTPELPIDRVVELSAGHYGGDAIAELFGE